MLSLFSCGKTRGLVVEMGEGATYFVPVFEGFALPHLFKSYCRWYLTAYLKRLLEERGLIIVLLIMRSYGIGNVM